MCSGVEVRLHPRSVLDLPKILSSEKNGRRHCYLVYKNIYLVNTGMEKPFYEVSGLTHIRPDALRVWQPGRHEGLEEIVGHELVCKPLV